MELHVLLDSRVALLTCKAVLCQQETALQQSTPDFVQSAAEHSTNVIYFHSNFNSFGFLICEGLKSAILDKCPLLFPRDADVL